MTTHHVKNNSQRINRFNQELEAKLRGQPIDQSELAPEDQRALNLAASLVEMDLTPRLATRQRLRWRLISQAQNLEPATNIGPPLEKLHLAVSKMALILLIVLVGLVFSNLAGLTSSNGRTNATAYATDALLGGRQDVEAQSLQITPKIVPTPIAPLTIVENVDIPLSSTYQSSPGSTEWSPTLIPIETP